MSRNNQSTLKNQLYRHNSQLYCDTFPGSRLFLTPKQNGLPRHHYTLHVFCVAVRHSLLHYKPRADAMHLRCATRNVLCPQPFKIATNQMGSFAEYLMLCKEKAFYPVYRHRPPSNVFCSQFLKKSRVEFSSFQKVSEQASFRHIPNRQQKTSARLYSHIQRFA